MYRAIKRGQDIIFSLLALTVLFVPMMILAIIIRLDSPGASLTATLKAIPKGYDIYHYHASGLAVMCFLPKLFRRKVVVTVHGFDWINEKWSRFAKAYIKLGNWMAAKFADRIIVVSAPLKEYFKETYNRDTVNIDNAVTPVIQRPPDIIKRKYAFGCD